MDKNHTSLVCVLDGEVVGGICFRPYVQQRFAEIAFCAVKSTQQVKGFGTIMMNELNEHVKKMHLTHFLTYADNFAVGYFKKQGFSDKLTIVEHRWRGYIKDYDGGTLMECIINPSIDYRTLKEAVRRHRTYLVNEIKKRVRISRVYEGLKKADMVKYRADPYAVPGIRKAGWKPSTKYTTGRSLRPFQRAMLSVLRQLTAHESSWPFREPVPATVEGYLNVIKYPVYLSLVKLRAVNGVYKTVSMFKLDLNRMCDKCNNFNPEESIYWKCAVNLEHAIETICNRHLKPFEGARNALTADIKMDAAGKATPQCESRIKKVKYYISLMPREQNVLFKIKKVTNYYCNIIKLYFNK